jgi:diguanylate cyclase (GGDEF)-like protein
VFSLRPGPPDRRLRLRGLANALAIVGAVVLLAPAARAEDVPAPTGDEDTSRILRFQQISVARGDSFVRSLLLFGLGFLGVGRGGGDGLSRFDGYGFKVFPPDAEDPTALADQEITALLEDGVGRLWIGTLHQGLHLWRPQDETFERVEATGTDPLRITALAEDRRGALWIGTLDSGLHRLDLGSGPAWALSSGPAGPDGTIKTLLVDRRDRLWVGVEHGGLWYLDDAAHELVQQPIPTVSATVSVAAVAEDRDGSLWVGTEQQGLFRLSPDGEVTMHLHADSPVPETTLLSDKIQSLLIDDQGGLWIGSREGLTLRDADGELRHARYDPADPSSLSDASVTVLYQDQGGVIWAGTQQGGLNRLGVRTNLFRFLREDPQDAGGLTSNRITSIADDSSGALWIGTFDRGLSRRDPATGTFETFEPANGRPDSLPGVRVMSLYVDSYDTLWAGMMAEGLVRRRRDGTFETFSNDPEDPESLSYNGVTCILEGLSGDLWIGTYRGGVNRFDRWTESFRPFRGAAEGGPLSSDQVRALAQESRTRLWVGTGDAGLDLLDPVSGTVVAFRHDPGRADSLGSDAVRSVLLDRSGTLWIGTAEGLDAWSAADREALRPVFQHYGEPEGLLGAPIWGALEDERGNIWLSTIRGLSRLDPRSGTFINFGRSYGLPKDGFKFGAYHRASDGTLYFGSNSGITALDPSRFASDLRRPPLVITRMLANNKEIAVPAYRRSEGPIPVGHRADVVAFEFAVLDFLAPQLNRFEYRLDNFDEGWTDLQDGRRATYTNLPAGRYTLRVRGANSEGVWSSDEAHLSIAVRSPPWATWWAYSLYGLAAAGIILSYSRAQSRRLEREANYARRLELDVQARTRALEEQNERLQYANRLLEIASVTDSLTGVRNRRFLLTNVERDIAQIDRLYAQANGTVPDEHASFLFLLCDLDGFKEINDRHGHSAGDLVLFQIRDLLNRACRSSDTLVRWGGDEFMIIGRSTSRETIQVLAERIRRSVANHLFDIGGPEPVRLTCSIGFASYPFVTNDPRTYSWEEVVELADRALFLAKRRGPDMWIGVFGTPRTVETPLEDLLALITERPELLIEEGSLSLQTSRMENEPSLRTGT